MHFTTSQKQAIGLIAGVFLLLALFQFAANLWHPTRTYDFSQFEQAFQKARDSIAKLDEGYGREPAALSQESPGNAPAVAAAADSASARTGVIRLSAGRKTANPPFSRRVNINTATVDELMQLPHIGPKIAARIVAYRTENGTFATPVDLMKVKGIGAKTFQKLRDFITTE